MNIKITVFIVLSNLVLFFNASCQNTDSLLQIIAVTKSDSIKIASFYELARISQKTKHINAIKYAEQGIALSKKINDSIALAMGQFISGSSYSELGLYISALEKLSASRKVFEQYKDTLRLINTIINTGNVFWFKNDYHAAIDFYNEALQYSQRSNHHKRHAILMNLAISYSKIGIMDSAIVLFQEATKFVNQTNDALEKALTYLNIGATYLTCNQLDSAKLYLSKSMEHKAALPHIILAHLMASQAEYYSKTNQFKKTYDYLDSCKHYAENDNSLIAFKEYYLVKFEIDTTLKNYESAVYAQNQLMQIKDSLNYKDQEERIANYKAIYNLKLKEQEITNLKNENALIKLSGKNNRILIFSLIIFIILSAILLFIYRKLNITKANSILRLQELNNKLSSQQHELLANNEELTQILEKLNDTQLQLVQSEKLASIGVLAAGVAHEINNPLNYINGGLIFLNDIKPYFKDNVEVLNTFNQAVKMINEGISKATTVVNTLGQFAYKQESELKPENLNSIIDSALKKIQFKIKADITIGKIINALPHLLCDNTKIETIFIQLLSNAIDAVDQANIPKKQINIKTFVSAINEVEYITVSVKNTGEHIDKTDFNKIFDPFFTTKDPNKGYGLGLSITYNLVKELNGNILVKNKPEGVEFIVMFPTK